MGCSRGRAGCALVETPHPNGASFRGAPIESLPVRLWDGVGRNRPPPAPAHRTTPQEAPPTVPLDPPTAYGLSALLVLLGRPLVQAGRGPAAFKVALAFAVFFALSVQPFLFGWPDWMYAYALPATELPPAAVAVPFFVAVAGAGAAGAYVSLQLVRGGRTGLATLNVLFGIGLWLATWAATWEQYFHIGTWAEWQQGIATPLAEAASFQLAMNVAGAAQGAAGIGLAAWVIVAGRRAKRRGRIQPDPTAGDWRSLLDAPACAPAPSVIAGEQIGGARPGDGAPLEAVACTPADGIPALLESARSAQAAWAAVAVEERAAALVRLRRRFLRHAEALARLLEEENGRPQAESWITEIVPNGDLFDHWARRGPALLQASPVSLDPTMFAGKRGVIETLPRGVVGLITPWNFPVALPLRTIVPALLAGNAVIWKPSEHAARSAALVHRILAAELPPDLVTLVQGGAEQARRLVGAGVDQVVFVGSPQTGRAVARAAAERLTPVALELGGKDAALVLHDADIERTANGVLWGALANAGQNCAAIERCYVDRRIAPAFVEKLRDRIASLRPGEDVGPLTTEAQRARVEAQLDEARARGVAVEAQGEGQWLRPVLLVDPPEDLALLQDETFGPLLPIVAVDGEEEMVRRANDSAYGLTASIWSKDTARAEVLGRRLHAGVITVNNHGFTGGLPQAPWSGVRGSGGGITGGPQGLAHLTRPRFVLVDRSRAARELWWYPYDASVVRLARGLARLRSGAGLGAIGEVIGGFLGARRRGGAPVDAAWPRGAPRVKEARDASGNG